MEPCYAHLRAAVAARQAELVALCARLVRFPSENPPGDTRAVAAFVADYLAAAGLAVQVHAPHPERPNVVATLGPAAARPHLLLNSHLDTFPAGEGWTRPPFGGLLADGRLYGRGASDMRAGLAASLLLARLWAEQPPPGRVTFSYSSDEEAGGTWGTRWLLAHLPALRAADACLIGDQCGPWAVGIGEKGGLWLRLRARGRAAHAAYGTRQSATARLVRALMVAESLGELVPATPPGVAAVLERQRPLVAMHWGEEAPAILDRVTVNIGTLAGGTSTNLVADQAEATLDIRLPVGLRADAVLEALEARLAAARVEEVAVEVLARFDPHCTPPDAPIVRAVVAASAAVRGEPALPVVRLGATDARYFRAAGIPTVVYGPTAHHMGGPDEFVTLDDLLTTAQVHACAALAFLCGVH
ncbi:MAG TPA: M20/M25/M40 family metallo-hydrolase [Chloroflexota bacterium]|jgi:succinyl-diaminopimelate desuccinylase|nr:M20/M25/M40 family metallo-hydrolase [Chloroflexota bacterium]